MRLDRAKPGQNQPAPRCIASALVAIRRCLAGTTAVALPDTVAP
jgi:hypothetical protein